MRQKLCTCGDPRCWFSRWLRALKAEFEEAAKQERMRDQAPEMYRAIIAKLKDCRESGDCADAALMPDEYCSTECADMARAVIAAVEKTK